MSKADKPNAHLDALIAARMDSHAHGMAEGHVSAGQLVLNAGHVEAAQAILLETLRRFPTEVGRVGGFLDFEQGVHDARHAVTAKPARKRRKKTEPCTDPEPDL